MVYHVNMNRFGHKRRDFLRPLRLASLHEERYGCPALHRKLELEISKNKQLTLTGLS